MKHISWLNTDLINQRVFYIKCIIYKLEWTIMFTWTIFNFLLPKYLDIGRHHDKITNENIKIVNLTKK
jgi:hypothetical protein